MSAHDRFGQAMDAAIGRLQAMDPADRAAFAEAVDRECEQLGAMLRRMPKPKKPPTALNKNAMRALERLSARGEGK